MCVCVRGREQARERAKDEKGISKAHERSRRNERGKREMSDKKATLWGECEIEQVRREEKAVSDWQWKREHEKKAGEGREKKKNRPRVWKEKRQRQGRGDWKKALSTERERGRTKGKRGGWGKKGPWEKEKGRGDSRRQSEADVLGSFRAMSRLGVQTSHGQHTKHRTQCPDLDSCKWHTNPIGGGDFNPPPPALPRHTHIPQPSTPAGLTVTS